MAQNDWIMDVLSDLRRFAGANGLQRLAAELDQTLLVAATEISQARSEERRLGQVEDPGADCQSAITFSGKSH
jgi:hypothetical protein